MRKEIKKEIILTVRVNEEMHFAIESLANKDERSTAWVIRKLIEEALVVRKMMKPKSKK